MIKTASGCRPQHYEMSGTNSNYRYIIHQLQPEKKPAPKISWRLEVIFWRHGLTRTHSIHDRLKPIREAPPTCWNRLRLVTPANRCTNYAIYRLGRWQRADSVDEHSKRSLITHSRTQRQTTKHTRRHTQKNLSLVLATVPWRRYHLGHVSLFHVFRPKVGGASRIGFNPLYMLTVAECTWKSCWCRVAAGNTTESASTVKQSSSDIYTTSITKPVLLVSVTNKF